jgi:hypothetical protein
MDQDQERDYEEEKYNEGLMHDEAELDEPAPNLCQAWAAADAAAEERVNELERQQAALGRDVFGFPLEPGTVNYRGVTPEGEWWEPKYADKTDADRTQYLGDQAAELAEAGDEYRGEIAREMTAAGVPAADVQQVVETASAWRESDHQADAYMDREAGQ